MMPLIPSWSAALAVIVLLAVGVLHVSHARSGRGYVRGWHAAHVAMVAGMVVMFMLPHQGGAGLSWAMAAAFGAAALAMASVLLRVTGVDRRVWAASMLDQVLMVYMLLPLAERPAPLTYVAVAYAAAAAVAWLVVPERFTCMTPPRAVPVRDRVSPRGLPSEAARASAAPRSGAGAGRGSGIQPGAGTALRDRPNSTSSAMERFSVLLTSNLTTGVRLTLMAMALAMAWMLLAMQQAPAMGTMPGM